MSATAPDTVPIPDTYQPVSQFGAVLIAALGPWMTLHLAWYCDAIGVMFDPVYTLVMDQGVDGQPGYQPGYGSLFDLNRCPTADLGYLGQFVGVQLPAGADDSTSRSLIRAETGLSRGTPTAILAAVTRNLNAGATPMVLERTRPDGVMDGYWFTVVVHAADLISASQLTADVNAIKPGGVMWELLEATWIISAMEAAGYQSITALEQAFASISNLEVDLP